MHLGRVPLLTDVFKQYGGLFVPTTKQLLRRTGNVVTWFHRRDDPLVDDEIGREELPTVPKEPGPFGYLAYCHVMYVVNPAKGLKPHDVFVEVCKMASTDIARAKATFNGATVHCGEVCGNGYFKRDVTMVIDDVIATNNQTVEIYLVENNDLNNPRAAHSLPPAARVKREAVQSIMTSSDDDLEDFDMYGAPVAKRPKLQQPAKAAPAHKPADCSKNQRQFRAAPPLKIGLEDIAGSIYVLKIITTSMQVFYYIGSTKHDPLQRMNAHTTPAGCVFKRLPKNAQVQRMVAVEYFTVPRNHSYSLEEAELMHAAKYMFKHGTNNVRGANFLSTFGVQPSQDEVMLLKHLNNLPYC